MMRDPVATLHIAYPKEEGNCGDIKPEGSSGAPGASIGEHGLWFSRVPGESESTPQNNIVVYPSVNFVAKIVEIMRCYTSGSTYFRSV